MIFLAFPIALLIWAAYFLYRNYWVYKTRIAWIHDKTIFPNEWNRSPTYDHMLYNRFWKWTTNFDAWAKPKDLILSEVRPDKDGQFERFMKGLK